MLHPLSYEGGDAVRAGQRVLAASCPTVPSACPIFAWATVFSAVDHARAALASMLVSASRG